MEYMLIKVKGGYEIKVTDSEVVCGKVAVKTVAHVKRLNIVQATNILLKKDFSAEGVFDAVCEMEESGMNTAHFGLTDGFCYCSE